MSDRKEVQFSLPQFNKWLDLTTAQLNATWRLAEEITLLKDQLREQIEINTADNGKWLSLQNEIIRAGFEQVAEAIAKIQTPLPPPQPNPLEVKFMFVVKDNHDPVNFSVVLGDVTDAEGNKIPDAQVDLEVVSSDDSVLSLSFDAGARTGVLSFGSPGVASLTAKVSSGGNLLGSGAADFTVTVGDPAAISSVALNFDGLTEAPPA